MTPTRTIDDAVEKLDERFPGQWDLWRASDGEWRIKIQNDVLPGPSLGGLLQLAAGYTPLPRIPRRPKLRAPADYAIRKTSGSSMPWYVEFRGRYCWRTRTKHEATRYVETALRNHQEAIDRWDEQYGPVIANGKEGKTFRYEDQ